jgi:riboflavin kinase
MTAPKVAPEDKELLKQLATIGALHDHVFISSSQLAERLGVSQQTASRKILELLGSGLILRRMGTRKQHIRIAPIGVDVLRHEFADYKQLFAGGERVIVRGKIVTGLGEGRYYISRDGYRKAFGSILGFDPYPGTLNIEVEPLDREKVAELKEADGFTIEPFQSEGRTFGAVKFFRAMIGGVEAAAIFPLRSHHVNVIELVSPHCLREELALTDGAEVEISLDPTGVLSS